ncbi:hypothetical protein [Amycolatopsis sp. NPDC054798]
MTLAQRRLPGVSFQARPSQSAEALPRMDIAGFTGFARTGPLGVPVVVEDSTRFTEIFGGRAELFRDAVSGKPVTGYLEPAVRAFFANGGKRCWVVRVAARSAVRSAFPVPGVAVLDADGFPVQAEFFARSAGGWADDLTVSAGLLARRVRAEDVVFGASVSCVVRGHDAVRAGDLIRVAYPAKRLTGMFVVRSAEARPGVTVVTGELPLLFQETVLGAPAQGSARWGTNTVSVTVADDPARDPGDVVATLSVPLTDPPAAGTFVRLDLGSRGRAQLLVREAKAAAGPSGRALVSGRLIRPVPPPPAAELATPATTAVLTMELRARNGTETAAVLGDLGLAPAHPRYAGALPTDEQLYAGLSTLDERRREPVPPLWAAVTTPRYPLAGPVGTPVLYPIGLSVSDGRTYVGAVASPGRRLERDGLAKFDPSLFLDPALADAGTATVLPTAEFLRDQSEHPRPLVGIHALLGVDEVTVVAVPDAVHAGWDPVAPPPAPTPPAHEPYVRPDPCSHQGQDFEAQQSRALPSPVLNLISAGAPGDIHLSWQAPAGATSVLEETVDPLSWKTAREVYRGGATTVDLYGRSPGTYCYRVRVETVESASDWSNGVAVAIVSGEPWAEKSEVDGAGLVSIQRAMTRMCAARGDQFALLTLPNRYRAAEAIAHTSQLRAAVAEERTLGFAGVYHPWLSISDDTGTVRDLPPDGATAGVFATRALGRGVWVAPANVALTGVVALTPRFRQAEYQGLQDAGVNLVRQEPRGFLTLSADTLSQDPDLRPIPVRLLLSLLRRVAVREAPAFVFEPNGDAVGRHLRLKLEAILSGLLARGAFAGATRAQSFQVRTSANEERLVVELRAAPSVPLRFLLVRLVHAGDGELTVDGV